MQKKRRQDICIILFSLVGHILLLLGFIDYSDKLITSLSDNAHVKVIKTYLYTSLPQASPKIAQQKTVQPIIKRDSKLKEKSSEAIAVNKADKSLPPAAAVGDNENQSVALLALLHTAIAQQQEYPSSAQEMGRQGRVTVKFMLKPNGQITQLHIVRSSDTASLDEAALTAVSKAAPFVGVDKYLTRPQAYSIDVVFNLD